MHLHEYQNSLQRIDGTSDLLHKESNLQSKKRDIGKDVFNTNLRTRLLRRLASWEECNGTNGTRETRKYVHLREVKQQIWGSKAWHWRLRM